MQLVQTLSVLALATGAVVAMPAKLERRDWGDWEGGSNRWWSRPDSSAEVTVTGYDSEPTDWNTAPTSAAPTSVAAVTTWTTTTVSVEVTTAPSYGGGFFQPSPSETPSASETWTEAWTESSAPAASTWATTAAPSPTATSAPSTGGSGGQDDYMSVVSQWRAAGGLPALTQDSTLEANALKTSTASTNGLEHELNPGTLAQVLAPGNDGNFESVYVGGWLCEIPTLPGLNGICATEAQGWDHSDGETGHAEILTSTSYTKIGCALAESTGVWACDLA